MIEIIAIVRRKEAAATRRELLRIGCQGYTAFPVLGRGKQRGLRGAREGQGLAFLPKVLFDVVVEDAQAQETVEAIIRASQTGQYGDGKIFVIQVDDTYRISTGAREPAAEAAEGASA